MYSLASSLINFTKLKKINIVYLYFFSNYLICQFFLLFLILLIIYLFLDPYNLFLNDVIHGRFYYLLISHIYYGCVNKLFFYLYWVSCIIYLFIIFYIKIVYESIFIYFLIYYLVHSWIFLIFNLIVNGIGWSISSWGFINWMEYHLIKLFVYLIINCVIILFLITYYNFNFLIITFFF